MIVLPNQSEVIMLLKNLLLCEQIIRVHRKSQSLYVMRIRSGQFHQQSTGTIESIRKPLKFRRMKCSCRWLQHGLGGHFKIYECGNIVRAACFCTWPERTLSHPSKGLTQNDGTCCRTIDVEIASLYRFSPLRLLPIVE